MRVKDPAALRRWRKQQRFSQQQLATLIRRSQNTIYLLESGGMKTCSEGVAIGIAAWLGVPWEELFEAEENDIVPKVTNAPQRIGQNPNVHTTRLSKTPHMRKGKA